MFAELPEAEYVKCQGSWEITGWLEKHFTKIKKICFFGEKSLSVRQ